MGGEIGREHEGGDQREIRLRRPVEENPADDGGARRIDLCISAACARPKRSSPCSNIPVESRGGVLPCAAEHHIASVTAVTLRDFVAGNPRRSFDDLVTSRAAQDLAAIVLVVALLHAGSAQEQRRGAYTPPAADTIHAVAAEHGMVVAQEKIAAQIGADMLRHGGNAVDAAVATGFAMAVTYPRAGNIGGGGFMVIHSASAARTSPSTIARPRRPRRRATCFSAPTASPTSRSRAIPRSASAFPAPSRDWRWRWRNTAPASSRWRTLLKPAIALARDGIVIADDSADTLPDWHRRLARWPSSAKIFSRADGTSLREGDTAGPDRSGGNAVGDCGAGTARILPGPGRGKTGEGGPRRRRHHDAGRSRNTISRDPRAGARQLSRLRHRLDAAALVRRRGAAGDAEHPRGLSDARHEAGLGALAACDDRGDEARLCRSRALSRRSRFRQRADRDADVEGLCGQAARQHRSRPRHAMDRCAVGDAAARRQQHHAFLGGRQPATRSATPIR